MNTAHWLYRTQWTVTEAPFVTGMTRSSAYNSHINHTDNVTLMSLQLIDIAGNRTTGMNRVFLYRMYPIILVGSKNGNPLSHDIRTEMSIQTQFNSLVPYPTTTFPAARLFVTTVPAPTFTLSPNVMSPSRIALAPSSTWLPSTGLLVT